jgi:GntR family transcriptional repressor for pyruvate dehydrogenase complex
MSEEDLIILKGSNNSARQHLKADNYEAALKDEIAFHTKIAEQTGNPLIVLLMEFIEDILIYYKKVFHIGIGDLSVILDAHERIFQAIENRDEDLAYNEMLNHIKELEDNLWMKEKHLSLKEVCLKSTIYQ